MYFNLNKRLLLVLAVLLMLVLIPTAFASDVDDALNQTQIEDDPLVINVDNSQDVLLESVESQDSLGEDDDVIVVENWDELQYYCSLKDKDYTLKLKDNTNFYPTRTSDSNYQIKVYNNVKIIFNGVSMPKFFINKNNFDTTLIRFKSFTDSC
mgnify:CR=1 FL=1